MLKSFKFARVKLFEFSTSRKTNNRLNTLKILTKDKLETINKTVSKTDDILSDKVNSFYKFSRFGIGALILVGGVYFTFHVLWEDYLTYKKLKHLNILTYGVLGFSTTITGVLVGNYLKNGMLNKTLPNQGIFFKGHKALQYSIGLFLLFATTAELIDRNLFFWGAGIISSIGMITLYFAMEEGRKNRILSTNLIRTFRSPCFLLIFLSIPLFLTYYKERSKEMKFIIEFKDRKNYILSK